MVSFLSSIGTIGVFVSIFLWCGYLIATDNMKEGKKLNKNGVIMLKFFGLSILLPIFCFTITCNMESIEENKINLIRKEEARVKVEERIARKKVTDSLNVIRKNRADSLFNSLSFEEKAAIKAAIKDSLEIMRGKKVENKLKRLKRNREIKRRQAADSLKRHIIERIKSTFSFLNGSNYTLTKYIKKNMNNPKSYKHIKTAYEVYYDYNYLVVKTNFRGTNIYGAIVKNKIVAKIDLNGDIVGVDLNTSTLSTFSK